MIKRILFFCLLVAVLATPSIAYATHSFITKPSAVTGQQKVESGNDWAYISWNPCTGATSYTVRWATGDYPSDNTSGNLGYSGTSTSANITSLTEGVNIYFSIFAIASSAGLSSCSLAGHLVKSASIFNSIDEIYWVPAQEDTYNPYLETATEELETYFEAMSGKSFTVTTSYPGPPAIYLSVNASQLSGYGDEAYRILIDDNGVTITGKTALACRHGAYDLLERMGVRWFFKSDAWTVVPDYLAELEPVDEIEEPDFIYRGIRTRANTGTSATWVWNQRNRVPGAAFYYGGESYNAILNNAGYSHNQTTYEAHPDWFTPTEGYQSYPWQINPTDNDVIDFAIDFALDSLASAPDKYESFGDYLPLGMASITPNDGGGYNPPFTTDLDWTNGVFSLSMDVLDAIEETYPTKYVSTPSYAGYSEKTTVTLDEKILCHVATAYNYTSYTIPERISWIASKGATMGIRDYVDIWSWYHDGIGSVRNKVLLRMPLWYALNARSYEGECYDAWGGRGWIFYALSKLMWDISLDLGDLFNDFCTKAFGDAAATMKEFYKWRTTGDNGLAYSIQLLDQAEEDATGDEAVLARIRQMECYTYYVWKFINIGKSSLSDEELEDFYTFVTKIRDWYLVTHDVVEESLHGELSDRGYSESEINALKDYATPTNAQVAAWMSEMLDEWGEYEYVASEVVNPLDLDFDLAVLSDNTTQSQSPIKNQNLLILVPTTTENETITVKVKGTTGHILFFDSSPLLVDKYSWEDPITEWYSVNFTAPASGLYIVHPTRFGSYMEVDIPDRPASIIAAPDQEVTTLDGESSLMTNMACFRYTYTGYFYVPTGTANFTLIYAPWTTQTITGNLTNPNEYVYDFSCIGGGEEYGEGGSYLNISSPVAGLWKIVITIDPQPSAGRGGYFGFEGIPPLVWNDPEYLLVEE